MIYLYLEDSTSGIDFWKFICSNIFPQVEVRNLGKHSNNSRLVNFVCNLQDKENTYLIAYDCVFDNYSVTAEYDLMMNHIEDKNMTNIKILDMISFEHILLSFSGLVDWCFAKEDDFKIQRKLLLDCRDILLEMNNESSYKEIEIIKKFIEEHPKATTIERICSTLLYYITRNTGFEVNKKKFGDCWKVNCCDWSEKDTDDMCGLEETGYLNSKSKAEHIFENSELKRIFHDAGIKEGDKVDAELIFE